MIDNSLVDSEEAEVQVDSLVDKQEISLVDKQGNSLVDSEEEEQGNNLLCNAGDGVQVNNVVDCAGEESKAKIEVDGGAAPLEKGGLNVNINTGALKKFSLDDDPDKEIIEKLWAYWKSTEGIEWGAMKISQIWCWSWVNKEGYTSEEWRRVLKRSWRVAKVWKLVEERCKQWLAMASLMGWCNARSALRYLEALYMLPLSGSTDDESGKSNIIVYGLRGVREVEKK